MTKTDKFKPLFLTKIDKFKMGFLTKMEQFKPPKMTKIDNFGSVSGAFRHPAHRLLTNSPMFTVGTEAGVKA